MGSLINFYHERHDMISAKYAGPAPAREWKDKATGELRSMARWALLVSTDKGLLAVNIIQPREFTDYPKPGSNVILSLTDRDGDLVVRVAAVEPPKS